MIENKKKKELPGQKYYFDDWLRNLYKNWLKKDPNDLKLDVLYVTRKYLYQQLLSLS